MTLRTDRWHAFVRSPWLTRRPAASHDALVAIRTLPPPSSVRHRVVASDGRWFSHGADARGCRRSCCGPGASEQHIDDRRPSSRSINDSGSSIVGRRRWLVGWLAVRSSGPFLFPRFFFAFHFVSRTKGDKNERRKEKKNTERYTLMVDSINQWEWVR